LLVIYVINFDIYYHTVVEVTLTTLSHRSSTCV